MVTIPKLLIQDGYVVTTNDGISISHCPKCKQANTFTSFDNPRSQAHCSSCHWSGDAVSYLKYFHNLNKFEAYLKAGRILEFKTPIPVPEKQKKVIEPELWNETALTFIENCNKYLTDHSNYINKSHIEICRWLHNRGIDINVIKKYKLGWNYTTQVMDKKIWGLNENINSEFILTQGLTIPQLDIHKKIIGIKIRLFNSTIKYQAIAGSSSAFSFFGNINLQTLVIVESELDAIALAHVAGDLVSVIAMGGASIVADNLAKKLLSKANRVIITYDKDQAGDQMYCYWKKEFPDSVAYPTPIGKDIGEAFSLGLDLRSWIMQAFN